MKHKVTVVVNAIWRGEIEADSKEEAYEKMRDELSYQSDFKEFLELRDESIDIYLDTL